MIIVGTAVVNASTGKVNLVAPMGFGTARGVRLSNYTSVTLTLINISGTEQSQEYLAPQTQMIYTSANIGATPIVESDQPASVVAEYLLVEWSTEPDVDFIGTYPAALPSPIQESPSTGAVIYSSTTVTPASQASPFVVDVHAFQSILLNMKSASNGFPQLNYFWLDANQNLIDQGVLLRPSDGTGTFWAGLRLNVKGYYLALTLSGNTNSFAALYVTASLTPITTGLDVEVLNPVGSKVYPAILTPQLAWDNNIPVNAIGSHALPVVNKPPVIGGWYHLQASYPSDAVFVLQLQEEGSTFHTVGHGDTSLLLTSGEGVTVNSTVYIEKDIYIRPAFLDNINARWFYIDVITASTTADMSMSLAPRTGVYQ